ncbi:TRAP transporter small permease [Salipiger abyssi]|uniref:TRAP transporter small permease n=1 Tax=Salipiger abyssi TaxID=1250539 RepID=UPI002E2A118C|nr:TRAP transporter small permease [Salipiger abyssi]
MSPAAKPDLPEIEEHHHPDRTDDPVWLAAIARVSTILNRTAAIISASFLVAMTLLILLEICMRIFSTSTYMADVLVGYGVAAITFLAAPWALEEGAMIRVTALTDKLSGAVRWIVEAFAIASSGGIMWFLAARQWQTVAKLFDRGSTSEHLIPIPLWIPESFFFVGLVLLLLQIIVRALRLVAVGHGEERALTL